MSQSEPHSYNISAKLQNGILSIFVHDTMTNCKWRQEFTQTCFPANKLYNVAKSLIMAIQEMINSTKHHRHYQHVLKPITILVYNQWCYLTINNSNLPSFALRPMEQESGTQKRNETCTTHTESKTKSSNNTNHKRATHQNNSNSNSSNKSPAKIKKNVDLFNSNKSSSSSKKKTIIVINKGLVARNIARFSQKQSTNSNSNKAIKKNKSKKKQPSRPPPTLNRPLTPTPTSKSPFLPSRGSNSSSSKPLTPIKTHNNGNVILPTHNNRALPIPVRPLPSLPVNSATTNNASSSRSQPFIPAPPVPKKSKSLSLSNKKIAAYNTQYVPHSQPRFTRSHSERRAEQYEHALPPPPTPPSKLKEMQPSFEPGQVMTACKKESSDSYSNSSPTSSGSLSMGGGSGVINICNSPEFAHYSESDEDEDDGIMSNTDDEDSSSFKQPSADSSFCRHGSMDSNSGSSASFLTNDGDEVITRKSGSSQEDPSSLYRQSVSVPVKKMKLYDTMTTSVEDIGLQHDEQSTDDDDDDDDDDEFDCEYSGNRYLDHNEYEFDIVRTPTRIQRDRGSKFGNTNMWMDEYEEEEVHSDQQEGVKRGAVPYLAKKKKYFPPTRTQREKPFKLTICVNGDKIDDMISHVIEQQIAEEEYYEEEEMEDEPFYDPNFLGISPYEDY